MLRVYDLSTSSFDLISSVADGGRVRLRKRSLRGDQWLFRGRVPEVGKFIGVEPGFACPTGRFR